MLVAVLSLGAMTAFAQEEVQAIATEATEVATEAVPVEVEATEEVAIEAGEATEVVAEEAVAVEEVAVSQDSYTEVAIEEVPEAISAALEVAHPGATISKAYVNADSKYKLEVANADGTTAELFADAEGNWIEM